MTELLIETALASVSYRVPNISGYFYSEIFFMQTLTPEERLQIMQIYYEIRDSSKAITSRKMHCLVCYVGSIIVIQKKSNLKFNFC